MSGECHGVWVEEVYVCLQEGHDSPLDGIGVLEGGCRLVVLVVAVLYVLVWICHGEEKSNHWIDDELRADHSFLVLKSHTHSRARIARTFQGSKSCAATYDR